MENKKKKKLVVRPPLVLPSRSRLTTLTTPTLYGGRFTRKQFWGHILALFLVDLLIAACGVTLEYSAFSGGLDVHGFVEISIGVMIFLATISTCITVFWRLPVFFKRMHDIGGSGWLVILVSIGAPIFELFATGLGAITGLIFFITLGSMDSEKGTNKYGASIKYPGFRGGRMPRTRIDKNNMEKCPEL